MFNMFNSQGISYSKSITRACTMMSSARCQCAVNRLRALYFQLKIIFLKFCEIFARMFVELRQMLAHCHLSLTDRILQNES